MSMAFSVFWIAAVYIHALLLTERSAPVVGVQFETGFAKGVVSSADITDASGLGASRKHPGILYTHNDRHSAAKLYMINATGALQAQLYIQGATSYDWEDLSVGTCTPGSRESCVFIGDFGDGEKHHAKNKIYRIPEPDIIMDQVITVRDSDKLEFSWDRFDCDTLMVDPDANVYVISKEKHGHGVVAMIQPSAWGTGTRVDITSTIKVDIHSGHNGPTGGDISLDGNEVLIKTKEYVYYWNMTGIRNYEYVLSTEPGTRIPYIHEDQGEAICWDSVGRDFFTVGEGVHEPLYRYVRM